MCIYHNNISVTTRFGQKKGVTAKCGKCIECLQERQNSWKLRMCKESEYWNHLYFFTLTFDDDHLPCVVVARDEFDTIYYSGSLPQCISYCKARHLTYDCEATMKGTDIDSNINFGEYADYAIKSTADNKQVSNFIKRIRTSFQRQFKRKLVMKYFYCSEYGPSQDGTRRPHYHGVVFSNENYNDLAGFFNTWQSIGRMEFKEAQPIEGDSSTNSASRIANYVSKYCAKGSFDSRQDDTIHKHIEKARFSCSNGIGSRWINERKNDWLKYVPSILRLESLHPEIIFDDAIIEKYFASGILYRLIGCTYYPVNMDKFGFPIKDSIEFQLLPSIKKEIENLCDNLKVYDGDYGYKMPRYFYERLFLRKLVQKRISTSNTIDLSGLRLRDFAEPVKFPYLGVLEDGSRVEFITLPPHHIIRGITLNPNIYDLPRQIKVQKTQRYVAESFLSIAIAYCLRMRAVARFEADVRQLQDSLFLPEGFDAFREVALRRDRSKLYASKISEAKLHDFYFRNSVVNPEFDI